VEFYSQVVKFFTLKKFPSVSFFLSPKTRGEEDLFEAIYKHLIPCSPLMANDSKKKETERNLFLIRATRLFLSDTLTLVLPKNLAGSVLMQAYFFSSPRKKPFRSALPENGSFQHIGPDIVRKFLSI
jgi:hypothetical protein